MQQYLRHLLHAGVCVYTVVASQALAEDASFDIPSQRLSIALADLGRQAKIEILLKASEQGDRVTRRVRGRMSAEEALRRMTAGLGLSARRVQPRLYIVDKRTIVSRRSRQAGRTKPPGLEKASEIVVTARRRLEFDRNVPLMITSMAPDLLQNNAVHDLGDLSRITSGLTATGQTSSSLPLLVMRGQRRAVSDQNRLPLVVYANEVALPNQEALSPLFDIASVEVLRGPQGTLFGRNATSGAILIRSVMPGNGIPSYVETSIGNFGLSILEGAVETKVARDVSVRVSGQRTRRHGFTSLVDGTDTDNQHSNALRAIVRIEPVPMFKATTIFEMLDADEKGTAQILKGVYSGGQPRRPGYAPYFDCGRPVCDVDFILDMQKRLGGRISQGTVPPLFQRRFRSVSSILEYGGPDFMVRNIAGWRSTHVRTAVDGDGTTLAILESRALANLRQWTEELQVQGRVGRVRYIGGAYLFDSAPNGPMAPRNGQFITPDNPLFALADYQKFRSTALYGQVNLALGRGRSMDIGLRYTRERFAGCTLQSVSAEPDSFGECLADGGATGRSIANRLTWTAAFNQEAGAFTFYLTTRRAFRSGGYNVPQLGGRLKPYQMFRPETFTDIEAGVKGAWQTGDFHGRLSAAGYVGFYRDIQRPLLPGSNFDGDGNTANDPTMLHANIGSARISGFDVDATLGFGKRTQMRLSASYIDGRYTHIDTGDLLFPLLGGNPLENRISYAPRFSGTISLAHEVPLPGALGAIGLDIDYSYRSSVHFAERADDPFATQPAYGLLGASITWREAAGRPLDIELWGRNLTNKYYASGGGTINPLFTPATIIPGPPRTFGLRLRYAFR